MLTTLSIAETDFALAKPARAWSPDSAATSLPSPARPVGMLGVAFDNVTKAEAVSRIEEMIATRRPHHVVTANVDFLVQAQRDVELRRILLEADLVLCDGTPLVWASRLLGNALPERAAGADVVPLLIRAAAEKGHRIFFLGAGPNVAAEAAERLRRQHPGLIIAGHFSPPFCDLLQMDFAEVARQVAEARPDILLVSFGCPKQEKWIAMHYHLLGVPVVMGVGATLDFIAGRVARAPVLMQRSGTEWIYRLAQEPRRLLRRYANDLLRFLPALALQWWTLRPRGRSPGQADAITSVRTPEWQQIRVTGDFSAATLDRDRGSFDEALQTLHHCQLDLSGVRQMDSTGTAVLVHWRKRLHAHGRRLMLLNPSTGVRRTLKLMRLTRHFWIVAREAEVPSHGGALQTTQPVLPPYPGGHTVAWRGEVTASNSTAIWGLTLEHFASVGPPPRQTFIIDLSRVRFIDSSGAEMMGRLRAWARHLKKDLRFLGLRPDVCNVLRMAKLADLLQAPLQ